MTKQEKLYAYVKRYYQRRRGGVRSIEILTYVRARVNFSDGTNLEFVYDTITRVWGRVADEDRMYA